MTINIPQSWRDIKLPQFEAALLVEQTEYDDEIDRSVEWIAALTGATVEQIEQLPLHELTDIARQLQWVKNPQFNEKIPKFFTAGGKMFEIVHQIEKLNAAQYAELCTWKKTDPMRNLDKVMASVTIERKWWLIAGKYDGARHAERAQLFRKHLSLAVIYPIALFFSQVLTRFLLVTQDSLANKLHEANKELIKELKQTLKEQETLS